MSKIRILHILGGLDVGGAETFVMNLYRHINTDSIQFDFVKHTIKSQFFDKEVENRGGKIYCCPRYKVYNHCAYTTWWKQFFKAHPEYKVIHGHVRSTAAIYLKIAKSYGLKTIAHSHNTQNGKGMVSIVKAVLQFPIRFIADYFFACSQAAGEWLFGKGITKRSNFFVIPNAIDTARFAYNPDKRAQMRKQLGLGNNFVVGHVGRLDIQKNHAFLLKIFAEVYKQNSQARLLLLGDGPLKATLIAQSKALHIDSAVLFCGNQDVAAYYQAMDVFVFPSLYEGLGIVLIEAQTCGLPCVISANLPQEVDLKCGLVTRVSLKQSPQYWAKEVLTQADNPRQSQQPAAQAKGYDIAQLAKWLQDFYIREVTHV